MKKMAILSVSMGTLFLVGISVVTLSGIKNHLSSLQVKAEPTGHSFTFDAATGSQFASEMGTQEVDVITGISSPIRTTFTTNTIGELNFGEGGRFVEAFPAGGDASYSLRIGINNLTHFEIDLGVEEDVGDSLEKDPYEIELRDAGHHIVKDWYSYFELDGNGNGTKHIEWDKGENDSTVVKVYVNLYFNHDSPDTNLYIKSLSLTWNC